MHEGSGFKPLEDGSRFTSGLGSSASATRRNYRFSDCESVLEKLSDLNPST